MFWAWLEFNDYFNSDYAESTNAEEKHFSWQPTDDENKLMQRFSESFEEEKYKFPRAEVQQIKLYSNIPIWGTLSSKTLKHDEVKDFLAFWNNPENFSWAETTWENSDSEFYIKFFDGNGIAVGKIFLCPEDCGMVSSKPFNPNTKFGGLSDEGKKYLTNAIKDPTLWE